MGKKRKFSIITFIKIRNRMLREEKEAQITSQKAEQELLDTVEANLKIENAKIEEQAKFEVIKEAVARRADEDYERIIQEELASAQEIAKRKKTVARNEHKLSQKIEAKTARLEEMARQQSISKAKTQADIRKKQAQKEVEKAKKIAEKQRQKEKEVKAAFDEFYDEPTYEMSKREKRIEAKNRKRAERKNRKIRIKAVKKGLIRLTRPKEDRGLFERIKLNHKFVHNRYEDIREDIVDRTTDLYDTYEDIQEYEDARDDKTMRKVMNGLRIALATSIVAGAMLIGTTVYAEVNDAIQECTRPFTYAQQTQMVQKPREYSENYMKGLLYSLTDQRWLYDYFEGEITEANWESLKPEYKKYVRNPVKAAEAMYNSGWDQSNLYIMTNGDLSSETWSNLPDEIRQYIREPIKAAQEAAEEGKDQLYLYYLSRGKLTHEFWEGLPDDIKAYVRDPIALAKEFNAKGDYLGYLRSMDTNEYITRANHQEWMFLPDELKEIIPDPATVEETEDGKQIIIKEYPMEENGPLKDSEEEDMEIE